MRIRELTKKVTIGILTIAMTLTGIGVSMIEAYAATAYDYEDAITYETVNDASTLYEKKEAPTKQGYVFGGWFSDAQGTTQIIDEENPTTLYAKFVPAYVLSVKAQNFMGVGTGSTSAKLRVVSAVDNSNHYKNVGFDIYFGNRTDDGYVKNAEQTTVYSKIKVQTKTYTPEMVFGDQAENGAFNIAEIGNIKSGSFTSTIYVKPYWTTNDGTKVYGLGKYVCVQDGIDGIISIPINLSTAQQIAVGMVEVTYPTTLKYYECQAGSRLLSKMSIKVDETNHTIKMVGNTTSVSATGGVEANSDVYASLRFKVAEGCEDDVTVGETRLNFTINKAMFCDWGETLYDLSAYAWDIQY